MTASLRFPSRTARRILVAALIAPLIAPATDAVAQRTHEHGAARLDVSVDAQTLTIRLESPLDNLVGFESAPKSEQQRTTVRRMAERFHRPQDLFQPTAAAACTPGSVSLASLAIPAALLAAPGAPVPAADPLPAVAGKGHADLEVDITFRCARPQALDGLEVRLFDAFPLLRRIDAGVVTAKGQSGTRLSRGRSALSW